MKILAKIIENQKIMTTKKVNTEVATINAIKINCSPLKIVIQVAVLASTANTVIAYICKNYKT